MCRAPASLHNTRYVASGEVLMAPPVNTIYGSIYLQLGDLGVASYHFDEPDRCYISYQHAPPEWTLSDGSRPPSQKLFEHASYDVDSRTFRGTINWGQNPFDGDVRWEYTMVFSDDFAIICGGEIHAYNVDNEESVSSFPKDLMYWRFREPPTVLEGCVFMQGGMLGLASYHFEEGVDKAYISYEAASYAGWKFDSGAPLPQKKSFQNPSYNAATRTFTGTIEWSPDTLGGNAKWEYTMVFAEDFSTISGGQVQNFNKEGEQTRENRFGHELRYALYSENEAQMGHFVQGQQSDGG